MLNGGEKLVARLSKIVKNVGTDATPTLKVGFLSGSTYPDGTSVAMVAAIQNYGAPARKIPPRPFFTNLVENEGKKWGEQFGKIAKAANYDVDIAFGRMGTLMASQLQTSIIKTNSPELSPISKMLRKIFGNHPEEIRGRDVGAAAALVAEGEQGASGTQAKPLIWTAHMINSVGYEYSGQKYDAPSKQGASV